MASLTTACRFSARLAGRKLARDAAARSFRTSAAALAAKNFTMPALSPTMTEGNIAAWRVKEGEKFSAGDLLLEIETDKATMDVEAQDDGIMMKIMQGDGTKGVQVGSRIGVVAEEGDDISALEIPPDESPKPQAAAKAEAAPAPATKAEASTPAPQKPASKSGAKAPPQTYPLLPSVAHLMKENNLSESVIGDMTPTGPNGRLLKGDILAYLGKINAGTPAEISALFDKLSHLDLSNIKIAKAPEIKKAEPAPAPAPEKPAIPVKPVQKESLITMLVSLEKVGSVRHKLEETLGVDLPMSAFIGRAADLANDELPLPVAGTPVSADDLFNQILGAKRMGSKVSRGSYQPRLSPSVPSSRPPVFRSSAKKADIIDFLAGSAKISAPTPQPARLASFPAESIAQFSPYNYVFSLTVPKAEERRAKIFLERVKTVLENEPGRLVL